MINMIKADFYRASKNIGIYIAIVLMLFITAISIYLVAPGNVGINVGSPSDETVINGMDMTQLQELSIGKFRELMLQQDAYKFDEGFLAHGLNMYYVFIFVAAVIVSVDFASGSVKNALTSAISRNKYFLSKFLAVAIICVVLVFFNNYIMFFSNAVFNGDKFSSDIWTITKITFIQLPPVFALISILVGIAFAARKTATYNLIAIPLLEVWQMVFGYVSVLFNIPEKVAKYELSNMFQTLASNPTNEYIATSFVVCAGIIVLFISMGYWSFKKAEIR